MTNNSLKLFTFIFLFFLGTGVACLKSSFSVSKTYLKSSNEQTSIISMGKLKIFEEGQSNQAYIQSNEPIFVTSQQIRKYKTVILIFKNDQNNKEYRTAINSVVNRQYSEKIIAVLSSSGEVIGFNYVQTRIPNQDITVQVQVPDKGVDHVFKIQTQQKPQQVQESFFTKYKWPLIIGGVLLFMTMNANPEKPQGQGQPRQ